MRTDFERLAGPRGREICKAAEAAQGFLAQHGTQSLLKQVGQTVRQLPKARHLDKAVIQKSFYGGTTAETDDLLAGKGLVYITEKGKLFLDCTSGHYQMVWGYEHPKLTEAVQEGIRQGVVWDNHANVPQWPVKRLAQKLVEVANPDCPELRRGDFSKIAKSRSRLNTVHLGVCTGSVACEAALKIMLLHYQSAKSAEGKPVIVTLDGNYHGTSMVPQRIRGMWPEFVDTVETITVQPNDGDELRRVFSRFGRRVAGFWAEPIMMNREAILIQRNYLRLARTLCNKAAACMVLDEIQTGFWWPEVLMFHQFGIVPDIVVVGKGLTAGFHPLAGLLYKRKYDCLAQYDAINTNGSAALAALVALSCIDQIEQNQRPIAAQGEYYFERLQELPAKHPDRVSAIHGKGLMAGIKFREVPDALAFHRRCVENGLWVRVHAYHEGQSTILTKLGLCADQPVADFIVNKLLEILCKHEKGT